MTRFRSREVKISSKAFSALEAITTLAQESCVDATLDELLCRMIDDDKALQDLAKLRKDAMNDAQQAFRKKHPEWQPRLTLDGVTEDTSELP